MIGKTTIEIEKRTEQHPCYNCKASNNARIHLPVAPRCNIQCNYCVRKFDCINESRPGVTSSVLTPEQAVSRYVEAKKRIPNLKVVGIAGPGDALANFQAVKQTLSEIRAIDPDVTFCLSTNGLMLPFFANDLLRLGVTHLTVTVNTVREETGAQIYDHINYLGKIYRDVEAARILLQNQLSGIQYLAVHGMVIKANMVLLKGINENEIPEIVTKMRDIGCKISNVMQLIPVKGSRFESQKLISNKELIQVRKECSSILPQMMHCRQCRADAVGTLQNDVSYKFNRPGTAPETEKPASTAEEAAAASQKVQRFRFAVCTKSGVLIDQHFGHASVFYIYDYQGGKSRLVEKRPVDQFCGGPEEIDEDDRIEEMVKTIDDCDAILCMRIGQTPSNALKGRSISVFTTYNSIDDGIRAAVGKLTDAKTLPLEDVLEI